MINVLCKRPYYSVKQLVKSNNFNLYKNIEDLIVSNGHSYDILIIEMVKWFGNTDLIVLHDLTVIRKY